MGSLRVEHLGLVVSPHVHQLSPLYTPPTAPPIGPPTISPTAHLVPPSATPEPTRFQQLLKHLVVSTSPRPQAGRRRPPPLLIVTPASPTGALLTPVNRPPPVFPKNLPGSSPTSGLSPLILRTPPILVLPPGGQPQYLKPPCTIRRCSLPAGLLPMPGSSPSPAGRRPIPGSPLNVGRRRLSLSSTMTPQTATPSPFPVSAKLGSYRHFFASAGLRHIHSCDSGIDSPGVRTLFGESARGDISHRDVRDMQLHHVIGSGGFGTVYQGVMRDSLVAIKRLRPNTKNNTAQMESYCAELNLLHLCHPNVVAALCAAPAGNAHDALLVMEYVSDRNLLHVINDVTETLDLHRRLTYALQISKALAYIHSRCVVHLDVKPSNILITPDDTCKLCDFGCSKLLEEDRNLLSTPTRPSMLNGTAAYRAPELLRGLPPSTKADIYAMGVTLWHMSARQVPYGGENHHVIIFGVVAQGLRPGKMWFGESRNQPEQGLDMVDGNAVEQSYTDLTSRCWDGDTRLRPSADVLIDAFTTWLHQQ